MQTTHTTLSLARHTLHRVDFDPATFTAADLFWLPHHAALHHTSPKRQREHLAGRLAAFYALGAIPPITESRAPLWPAGMFGSISHCASTALAVISSQPVGVDIETLFSEQTCAELTNSIIDDQEHAVLRHFPLAFPQALTLAFSAKESLYKAFSTDALPLPGFASAKITALTATHLTLCITDDFSAARAGETVLVAWQSAHNQVITLASGS